MRKISYMYQKSGGTKPTSVCATCRFFQKVTGASSPVKWGKKDNSQSECLIYKGYIGGEYAYWDGKSTACRFYEEIGKKAPAPAKKKKVKYKADESGQLSFV